jgi:hypothetical protein
MMNKHLPAFLFHMLKEQNLPNNFIHYLLKSPCKARILAEMHRCKWDAVNKVLTTEEDVSCAMKMKAFKRATWLRTSLVCLCRAQGIRRGTWLQRPFLTSMIQIHERPSMTVMRALASTKATPLLFGLHPRQGIRRLPLRMVWLI